MWPIKATVAVVFTVLMAGSVLAEDVDVNSLAAYYGFEDMEVIKLDWGIQNLRIADFNGDGRNDIAVVNNRKAKIELLIQKEDVSPGEAEVAVDPEDVDINLLTPPTRFDSQNVAVSQKVYSFVCGDLNSDGMMDLAFYGEPKGLYIILQKAGEAEAGEVRRLKWRTRKKIKIDDGLVTADVLVCADLNNDGADDLALAGRDAVYLILQKADGSLAEPVKYPTTALTLGVEVGDTNGDGINDLVLIANDREEPIHVRFGLETGQLGPQERFFIEKPFALQLYDVDGADGDEILSVNSGGGRLICYEYGSEKGADADWPVLFYPLASGEGSTRRDLAVGDLDGDVLADVVISEPGAAELILYRQRAGLGLSEPVRFPAFADIESLSGADVDGDGKTEVVVLSVKEKVIGLAEFEEERLSFPKPLAIVGEPLAVDIADVDHDGGTDCVYVSKDANDMRALRVIYDMGQADEAADTGEYEGSGPALELEELASNPDGLRVLDVDQDGLEDILIFVKYELPLLVRQTQKRSFELIDSPGAQMSLIKDAFMRSIAVADVDGQAGEELLVAQQNFARSLVFAGGEGWSIIDQYNARGTEDRILAVAAFDIYGEGSDSRPA
ncbi:MAG: VCBS repeat-containing protein, partial [Planctomycetota bacterium]